MKSAVPSILTVKEVAVFKFLFGSRPDSIEEMLGIHTLPKRSEAEKSASKFKSIFGFQPEGLPQERYRKEALIKLASLATNARDAASDLARSANIYETSYRRAVEEYFGALEFLEYYDQALAGTIPHWTELPAYMQEWLRGGKTGFTSPAPPNSTNKQITRR